MNIESTRYGIDGIEGGRDVEKAKT